MADDALKRAGNLGLFLPHPVVFSYLVTQTPAQQSEVVNEIAIHVANGPCKITDLKGYGSFSLLGARLIIRARNSVTTTTLLDTTSASFTTLGVVLTLATYTFQTGDILTVEVTKPGPQELSPFSLIFRFESSP